MTERRRRLIDSVLALRQPDLTVLAERLHKPRNFSAIVRTCDAVGISEVHAVPGQAGLEVHWNTSQGAEKWVRVRPHENLSAACAYLRDRGFQLVAAHLSGQAVDYRQIDYTVPTALVVGTELFGVSNDALAMADRQVRIPMQGMTRSLNVSVACAIVLYEAMRQRDAAGMYGDGGRLDAAVREQLRFEWMHPALAGYCRARGMDYPPLDEDGEVAGTIERGEAPKASDPTGVGREGTG
jgi:tRNA (guanosine-2'-O-)-methyltransferase